MARTELIAGDVIASLPDLPRDAATHSSGRDGPTASAATVPAERSGVLAVTGRGP